MIKFIVNSLPAKALALTTVIFITSIDVSFGQYENSLFHPAGMKLVAEEVAPDVFAVLSTKPAANNGGFIVGDNGVLVVDAQINGEWAEQLQKLIRAKTKKPITYLVNSSHIGYHTFGNYAFPKSTAIISHTAAAEFMQNFSRNRAGIISSILEGDSSVLKGIRLRLPDITIEKFIRIDLGNKIVEIHHFAPGSTSGDLIVYVPESKTIFVGNLLIGDQSIPWLLRGDPASYISSLQECSKLDFDKIVCGHGPPGYIAPYYGAVLNNDGIVERYINYLKKIHASVNKGIEEGKTKEEIVTQYPLTEAFADLTTVRKEALPLLAFIHSQNLRSSFNSISSK